MRAIEDRLGNVHVITSQRPGQLLQSNRTRDGTERVRRRVVRQMNPVERTNAHPTHRLQWPGGNRARITTSRGGPVSVDRCSVWNLTPMHTAPRTEARWSSDLPATGPTRRIDQTSTQKNVTTYQSFPPPSRLTTVAPFCTPRFFFGRSRRRQNCVAISNR